MDYTVLIVDDERKMCLTLAELLRGYGLNSDFTTDPLEVIRILNENRIDMIILDIKMPKINGIDLLQIIREKNAYIPIIMITGYPSVDDAVLAMKFGASDFLTKPLDIKKLIEDIQKFSLLKKINEEEKVPIKIIFSSSLMGRIVEEIKQIAPTNVNVLITGESGTGKELVAELIHSLSPRKHEKMIKVNCASIPESLLESELFGHEAGAFTDAKKALTGKFELAEKGTLFLDEIGDMNLTTQPKILRALQEGEIQRLGSEKTIKVKPRVIAASNRDLKVMMERGKFREDLYFRLSVVSIHLPSLRQRKEDVLELVKYFIEQFNETYNKQVQGISSEVKGLLLRHAWPGNIRELKNCIERAVIFAQGEKLQEQDLPSQYRQFDDKTINEKMDDLINLVSRDKINEALDAAGGVKYKAAELLNISRRTLYNRMKTLGME